MLTEKEIKRGELIKKITNEVRNEYKKELKKRHKWDLPNTIKNNIFECVKCGVIREKYMMGNKQYFIYFKNKEKKFYSKHSLGCGK